MLQQKFRVSAKGFKGREVTSAWGKKIRNSFKKIIAPLREFWGGQGCTPDRGTNRGGGHKFIRTADSKASSRKERGCQKKAGPSTDP